jgi:hypothetical protein
VQTDRIKTPATQFQYLEDLNAVSDEIPDTKLDSRTSLLKFLDGLRFHPDQREASGRRVLANRATPSHRFKPDFSFKAFGYSSLLSMIEDFRSVQGRREDGDQSPIYYLHPKRAASPKEIIGMAVSQESFEKNAGNGLLFPTSS